MTGNALSQAAGPSALRNYVFEFGTGGARLLDEDPSNPADRREYFHDGQGRVRSVELGVPDGVGGWNDQLMTILYDHRSRPYFTSDLNLTTGVESRQQLYWDTEDRLINRATTPDTGAPYAQVIDVYAPVGSIAVGSIQLDYTGTGPFERHFYDLRDPVGLPIARYEVVGGSTYSAAVWSAEWTPYGELESQTGELSQCMNECRDRHGMPWTPFVVVPVPWLMWLGECLPRFAPRPVPSRVPMPAF